MKNEIIINFGNITEELNDKNLVLFSYKNGFYIEDKQDNVYMIDKYYLASYIDKLISNNTIATFTLIDFRNFNEHEKKYFDKVKC